ncbi:hypothetical protein DOY81_015256, partial [Sarcophaga bullata]
FRNRNLGAYSFQNAFFYLQFADDPLSSQAIPGEDLDITKLRAALVKRRGKQEDALSCIHKSNGPNTYANQRML